MYLDNNASTQCDFRIVKLWQSIMQDITIGNPYSLEHAWGWKGKEIITQAKEDIANHINALPDEIIFTSGATESNNLAVIGTAMAAVLKKNKRKRIIVSSIEHKCILNSALHIKELFQFEIVLAPVMSDGTIDLTILENIIDHNTLLLSIMTVNNETGVKQPIHTIGDICKKQGVIFHTDAVQSLYFDLDVIKSKVDMLSLSGHKMYAPKGIGILYISNDILIKPRPILYGGEQQSNFRSGTISPALCASMAKALDLIEEEKEEEPQRLVYLKNLFLQQLKANQIEYQINGTMEARHPGNLNIYFPNIDIQMLIYCLQPRIALSTGAACNAGIIQYSYVLQAMGLSKERIESSLRLCWGRFNTKQETLEAANIISTKIKELQKG